MSQDDDSDFWMHCVVFVVIVVDGFCQVWEGARHSGTWDETDTLHRSNEASGELQCYSWRSEKAVISAP